MAMLRGTQIDNSGKLYDVVLTEDGWKVTPSPIGRSVPIADQNEHYIEDFDYIEAITAETVAGEAGRKRT